MPLEKQVVVRLSEEQYAWLLVRAERIRREEGKNASVSDVVRRLIEEDRSSEGKRRRKP